VGRSQVLCVAIKAGGASSEAVDKGDEAEVLWRSARGGRRSQVVTVAADVGNGEGE
jgi:hypothetical protein